MTIVYTLMHGGGTFGSQARLAAGRSGGLHERILAGTALSCQALPDSHNHLPFLVHNLQGVAIP